MTIRVERISREGHLRLGLGVGLLGEENGLDVWQHTTLGDGDSCQQFVQLLVVTDGELEVTGDDSGLLVVTSGVTCQLEDFSGEVLQDCGQVDWGASSDSLGVVALAEQTVDTADWELKSGTGRPGLGLRLDFASLSSS